MRLDDITLMAYADGELAGSDRDRVREMLHIDPSAMRIVADYRIYRGVLEREYANVDFSCSSGEQSTRTRPQPRYPFGRPKHNESGARAPARSIDRGLGNRAALAASLVVALGMAAATGFLWYGKQFQLSYRSATSGGSIVLGSVSDDVNLFEALSDRPSNKRAPLDKTEAVDTRFIPVADFYDKFGNFCREIEVLSPQVSARPTAVVVACRDPASGAWAVVGAAATTPPMTPGKAYVATEAEALESVRGILDMIGARRRTTAREVESKTR